jgi:uncharacterized membrane protein YkvA (DUF1232 family)
VTGRIWLDVIVGVATALLLSWLALVIALAIRRPKGDLLKESLRLLPDQLRLLRRLTTNRDLPTGVRVRVALLVVYLAIPIDVIPDFNPILGYADDAIVAVLILRSVCRRLRGRTSRGLARHRRRLRRPLRTCQTRSDPAGPQARRRLWNG